MEPGAERYLLHFGLKKASVETNFTCIFTKEYPKFDKLRDLVYVHSKPTFTGELSRLIRSTLPQAAEAVGDRYNAPLEYLQPTAAGVDGLPAWFLHILQNDRLSDQHVAC